MEITQYLFKKVWKSEKLLIRWQSVIFFYQCWIYAKKNNAYNSRKEERKQAIASESGIKMEF